MKHEKWSCPKCSHREYDLDEMRVAIDKSLDFIRIQE